MKGQNMKKRIFLMVLLLAVWSNFSMVSDAIAASAKTIDREVKDTLDDFKEIKGSKTVIKEAKGLLVFPKVFKAGFGIGGE